MEEVEIPQKLKLLAQKAVKNPNLYIGLNIEREKIENSVINKIVTIDYILHVVCLNYGLSISAIHLKTRDEDIRLPRQIAHFFAKEFKQGSLKTIGEKIGGKDHATVLHSNRIVNNYIESNRHFAARISIIRKQIIDYAKEMHDKQLQQ